MSRNTSRGRGRNRYNNNNNHSYFYSKSSNQSFCDENVHDNSFLPKSNPNHRPYPSSQFQYKKPNSFPNNGTLKPSYEQKHYHKNTRSHQNSTHKPSCSNRSKYFEYIFPFKNSTFEKFLLKFHLFYETHTNMDFGERIYNLRFNLKGIYKAEYSRILSTYSLHDYYKILKHLLAFDSSISGNSFTHVENILSFCCCDICKSYYDRVKDMQFSYLNERDCRTKQAPYKIETMKCYCVRVALLE